MTAAPRISAGTPSPGPEPAHDRTPELMRRLLLDRDQTAELLGVGPKTIEYLHRMGQLRGVKVGKGLRWRPADAEAFVKSLEPERD